MKIKNKKNSKSYNNNGLKNGIIKIDHCKYFYIHINILLKANST